MKPSTPRLTTIGKNIVACTPPEKCSPDRIVKRRLGSLASPRKHFGRSKTKSVPEEFVMTGQGCSSIISSARHSVGQGEASEPEPVSRPDLPTREESDEVVQPRSATIPDLDLALSRERRCSSIIIISSARHSVGQGEASEPWAISRPDLPKREESDDAELPPIHHERLGSLASPRKHIGKSKTKNVPEEFVMTGQGCSSIVSSARHSVGQGEASEPWAVSRPDLPKREDSDEVVQPRSATIPDLDLALRRERRCSSIISSARHSVGQGEASEPEPVSRPDLPKGEESDEVVQPRSATIPDLDLACRSERRCVGVHHDSKLFSDAEAIERSHPPPEPSLPHCLEVGTDGLVWRRPQIAFASPQDELMSSTSQVAKTEDPVPQHSANRSLEPPITPAPPKRWVLDPREGASGMFETTTSPITAMDGELKCPTGNTSRWVERLPTPARATAHSRSPRPSEPLSSPAEVDQTNNLLSQWFEGRWNSAFNSLGQAAELEQRRVSAPMVRGSSTLNIDCTPRTRTRGSFRGRESFRQASTYLIVCAGTLWDLPNADGKKTFQESEAEIAEHVSRVIASGKQMLFITNSVLESKRSFVKKLLSKGIRIDCSSDVGACEPTQEARSLASADVDSLKKYVATVGHTCGLHLRRSGASRPFVIASHGAVLEDLRDAGIRDYIATCADCGTIHPEYCRVATEKNVEELLARNGSQADAVVIAISAFGELTPLMMAVAARYLGLGRDRQPISRGTRLAFPEESPGRAPEVPLVLCCSDKARRRVTAAASSTMARVLNVNFDVEGICADARFNSELFLNALRCPQADGGHQVEVETAVLVTSSLDVDVEFANRAGIRSLLVSRSLSIGLELASQKHRNKLPCWTLPSLADI